MTDAQTTSRPPAPSREDWLALNDAYLGAALEALRQGLMAMVPPRSEESRPHPRRWPEWSHFFGRDDDGQPLAALPSPDRLADARKAADAAREKARAAGMPPTLDVVAERFGLSEFEREILLLCASVEMDTRIAGLMADAQGDPARAYPTFALAMALFDRPAWEAISPQRPLRAWRMIDVRQHGSAPLMTSPLAADERLVSMIKGLNTLDDRIEPLLVPFDAILDHDLPKSQDQAAAQAAQLLSQSPANAPAVVQLTGPDPVSKQLVAQAAATRLGLTLYRLPGGAVPAHAGERETLARLWHRESQLAPVALYIDAHDDDPAPEGGPSNRARRDLERLLARTGGIFLVGTHEPDQSLGLTVNAVPVAKPSTPEQLAAWCAAIPSMDAATANRLTGNFDLTLPQISAISRTHQDGDDCTLWQACLDNTGGQMDQLAQRLDPRATWDDLVLPEGEETLLRQIAAQVAGRRQVYDDWGFRARMNRGLGISALFAGDSGTGKTMAAEVLANHLNLNLYRIDLSAVVSKYIGETEKNLRKLFDAAEAGGAILFFDEADALFGKRSQVRDSHDRYANIETSYLLQRIESYRGLAVLATNMRGSLDDAFLRRLRFVVSFPYPGPALRRAIWARAWPAQTPTDGIDLDVLARLNLAGGNIATVAMNAAFMAAAEGGPVTMERVLAAARIEYEKLERPINAAEFTWPPVRARKIRSAEAAS